MVALTKTQTEFELSPTLAVNELVVKKRLNGEDILHMGFGESPFPVPERLAKALQENTHFKQYLPTAGLSELREAVADYYQQKVGLDTSQFDVLIAPGSKLILYSLQMAVAGDLLMPVPSWVSYKPQAHMLGTEVIKVPTELNDDGFHIAPDVLRNTIKQARQEGKNPGKLLLNYPSNPTGLTISEDELQALVKVCQEEDIFIISDEIYGFISNDNHYRTIARYAPEITAVSTGLSKHLSLGGWRIGLGLIPKAIPGLFQRLTNIASELWSCVPAPIQYASIEAYKGHDDIEAHIAACSELHCFVNRYISEGLKALGVKAPTPQGAFYNYPDFYAFRDKLEAAGIKTSQDLASHLLQKYNLSSLPGVAFGAEPEVLTLRLSGCDYDGEKALEAYIKAKQDPQFALDESFIEAYAPRVKRSIQAFGRFMEDIG
ncbi:aminotransferase class I/II-fold pyridoxal phosphate-dependent enzyme [Paraneptunicella aestuarii]|uniref:pyridoxal phosphate-dependent aminotransferase n=1 Tax=Paraneptunicella aestuarii TaxID=2831148 RepID=UPI001E629600|nr:aminotransferase class I/II-fold pyridoxal phosphate-dependent enzyme [Paraneptunicella aestuarii]UAA38191.1 aminotransferase class I/II-fold pyridoxal phosphate-dependent enzyme [Paraneptunicella aestuarii]